MITYSKQTNTFWTFYRLEQTLNVVVIGGIHHINNILHRPLNKNNIQCSKNYTTSQKVPSDQSGFSVHEVGLMTYTLVPYIYCSKTTKRYSPTNPFQCTQTQQRRWKHLTREGTKHLCAFHQQTQYNLKRHKECIPIDLFPQ